MVRIGSAYQYFIIDFPGDVQIPTANLDILNWESVQLERYLQQTSLR